MREIDGFNNQLLSAQYKELIGVLKNRFEQNPERHQGLQWAKVQARLIVNSKKLWSLNEMERTGGEPDVIWLDKSNDEYVFYDCCKESPIGRRNICYDRSALESRKNFKPKNNAVDMSTTMGIELLAEDQYLKLQQFGNFDTKTSSWLKTPIEVRKLGGAIFGDHRFGRVFVYHNGAESYYNVRGFRGLLRI